MQVGLWIFHQLKLQAVPQISIRLIVGTEATSVMCWICVDHPSQPAGTLSAGRYSAQVRRDKGEIQPHHYFYFHK